MAITRDRLDKIFIDDQGRRWGQFRVTDLELFSIPSSHVKSEIMKAADRLGLNPWRIMTHKSADECGHIIYGQMREDVQQPDEVVPDYVSNRRHIDLSILE